jgi:hypothetical protein
MTYRSARGLRRNPQPFVRLTKEREDVQTSLESMAFDDDGRERDMRRQCLWWRNTDFPRNFASAVGGEGAHPGRMSDATKVRREGPAGGRRRPPVALGHRRPGAKLERTSANRQRIYASSVQGSDWGPVGCAWPERARGASEPRHMRPGNRGLQHGELVSEQDDLGEQRPARAKRVRQGGGGTRTASRTSAKVTPTPSTSR